MGRAENEIDLSTYSGRLSAEMRETRKNAGISLEKVTQQMKKHGWEVSVAAYRHWENGTRKPPLDAIPMIAKSLKVSPHDILPQK